MAYRYDVYGVGNAIVDTEVAVEDAFLAGHSLDKGIMTLVSAETQAGLLESLQGHVRHGSAGGSAANTMTAVAQFGGAAFFTGKIGDDMHGALYRESLAETGVDFDMQPTDEGPTGACVILVTPDGERTMQTSLGAASTLGPDDITFDALRSSRIVYVEGYLLSTPSCAKAAERAMSAAADAGGVRVALSLSDPGIAGIFIDDFRRVTRRYVDILFCNEHEAEIYAGGGSREERLRAVGADAPLVFMTCGADGALVFDAGNITRVPGHVVPVVDTTGAGDVFAAGALFGLTHGLDPTDAGKLGAFAAARVVTEFGARLPGPLHETLDTILSGAHPLG
ncbi:MAG: adenosine kinase [Chloroflexota bacterium]|nr:adenosine kinase [Chloroflexota bacterium]MDE2886518.1 adenosine kinase [Chloroflexota bacterium]